MRIMHYSLGFPPYRRGGMTKYCVDLMIEQKKAGYDVGMIWPGRLKNLNGLSYIKKKSKTKISDLDLDSFELINPMPVPLLDGISEIEQFIAPRNNNRYIVFFKENPCDVLHVHTLMGLPYELIEAANECGIKTVFTSHDYFGLCPKGSLFYNSSVCDNDLDCHNCQQCNKNALSIKKIKVLQSPIYKALKDTAIVKAARSYHLSRVSNNTDNTEDGTHNCDDRYLILRQYYISLLNLFNLIHFNSSLTQGIYNRFHDFSSKSQVISITHGDIKDNRVLRKKHDKLQIAYLGSCVDKRKGFYLLQGALHMIDSKKHNSFRIHTFGECPYNDSYIIKHDNYHYNELSIVLQEIDVVVLPSIWYETFGFTALEALSFGIPVILTNHVGACDLLHDDDYGVVTDCSSDSIENSIMKLVNDPELVVNMNRNICNGNNFKNMESHSKEIFSLYIKVDK